MPEIDPTFLEALPAELRAEVLLSQQTQQAAARAQRAAAGAGQGGEEAGQESGANAQGAPGTAGVAAAAAGAPASGASSGTAAAGGSAGAPAASASVPGGSSQLDPEFLAALPPDLQAEVLAQQQALQMMEAAAAAAAEGHPADMDSASIIATLAGADREEVRCFLSFFFVPLAPYGCRRLQIWHQQTCVVIRAEGARQRLLAGSQLSMAVVTCIHPGVGSRTRVGAYRGCVLSVTEPHSRALQCRPHSVLSSLFCFLGLWFPAARSC